MTQTKMLQSDSYEDSDSGKKHAVHRSVLPSPSEPSTVWTNREGGFLGPSGTSRNTFTFRRGSMKYYTAELVPDLNSVF